MPCFVAEIISQTHHKIFYNTESQMCGCKYYYANEHIKILQKKDFSCSACYILAAGSYNQSEEQTYCLLIPRYYSNIEWKKLLPALNV